MQPQRNGAKSLLRRTVSKPAKVETIFDVLVADHRAIAAVFEDLKAELEEDEPDEPDEPSCLQLFLHIDALLSPHARAEEQLVYPAFAAVEGGEDPVAEAIEEHALVHQIIAQLKDLDEVDPTWCAKAKVLMELVEHHVEEEEGEPFAIARKGLDKARALALASEFATAKASIGKELGLPTPEQLDA